MGWRGAPHATQRSWLRPSLERCGQAGGEGRVGGSGMPNLAGTWDERPKRLRWRLPLSPPLSSTGRRRERWQLQAIGWSYYLDGDGARPSPLRVRLLERITSPLTVGGDLVKRRVAQR